MIKKTYIPGKPRNPKLSATAGTSRVGKSEFNQVAGSSHEHPNKDVLDLISQSDIDVLNLLSVVDGNIKVDASLWTTGELSAHGLGEDGGGGGGFDRLDKWVDYDSSKSGWVLSAFLGKDLDTRVGANSASISDLSQRVDAIEGVDSDKNFVYTQGAPSDTWTISHPLNKYPSVTIIDSGGTEVIGNIEYIDTSTVVVTFASGFSGKAILN
jgi:hypothetical protein